MIGNTAPFDVTGHPAMSVPCGMSDGLPVGLMLIGKHFDEATIYRRRRRVRAPATGKPSDPLSVAATSGLAGGASPARRHSACFDYSQQGEPNV